MTRGRSLKQLMDLTGRVALVTGGAGHIGSEAARGLAELGANIAVVDYEEGVANKVAKALSNEYGVKTIALAADLADDEATRQTVEHTVEQMGGLNILVNSAAFVGTTDLEGWVVPFEEQTADTWRKAMDVNLTSIFVLCQAAAPYLKAAGNGSIINISSIYGVVAPDMRLYDDLPMGNPGAYAASKSGLIQFTNWLSTNLAPHVRANALTPGGVFRNQEDVFVARYNAKVPLERMATEEDMKGAIAYLASDLSSYVTGQNLVVDGGFTVW